MARALWLPQVLRSAGLKVEEHPGWRTRGGDSFNPIGVMAHHTAGRCPRGSLGIVVNGRSGLPGPLAQLLLDCNGIYVICASGRANHAGSGDWRGITSGNTSFIGIEAEHPGTYAAPWPAIQLDAYYRGTAAILRHLRRGPEWCCAHREWANPPGRKIDPIQLNMNDFRTRVAQFIGGTPPTPPPAPKDVDMDAYIVFHPAFPVGHFGKLQAGKGHWYVALPNGTSRWLGSIAHKDHLVRMGASHAGDVGTDWFTVYPPLNGPHHNEYKDY